MTRLTSGAAPFGKLGWMAVKRRNCVAFWKTGSFGGDGSKKTGPNIAFRHGPCFQEGSCYCHDAEGKRQDPVCPLKFMLQE
jgi:hypothetical protein